jgi:hypothetical protein
MKPVARWTVPFLRRARQSFNRNGQRPARGSAGTQVLRAMVACRWGIKCCASPSPMGLRSNDDAAATQAACRILPRGALLVLLLLPLILAPTTAADKETVRLECTPRTFHVVPGEPIRLELTVRANSAASLRLHIPGNPLLKLRAVEKLPIRQTPQGVIVHKRVLLWQAFEPGAVKLNRLSVETKKRKLLFPEVTITVRDPGP